MAFHLRRPDEPRLARANSARYESDLERHALPFFARTSLSEIEPRDIKRLIAALIDQGLRSSSVRRRLRPCER